MKEARWKVGSLLLYTDKEEHESAFGIVVEDKKDGRFGVQWMDEYYSIEFCGEEEQQSGIKLITY